MRIFGVADEENQDGSHFSPSPSLQPPPSSPNSSATRDMEGSTGLHSIPFKASFPSDLARSLDLFSQQHLMVILTFHAIHTAVNRSASWDIKPTRRKRCVSQSQSSFLFHHIPCEAREHYPDLSTPSLWVELQPLLSSSVCVHFRKSNRCVSVPERTGFAYPLQPWSSRLISKFQLFPGKEKPQPKWEVRYLVDTKQEDRASCDPNLFFR